MKSITVAIPTYNRKHILKIMASSLLESNLTSQVNIRIYDDCSTEFDYQYLKKLFPTAASIMVNEKNVKADKNMLNMYKDFLLSDDEYFFNADSDLIFSSNWLKLVMQNIEESDGVISLFNTKSHETIGSFNSVFLIKQSLGAAGVFFTRKRVKEILDSLQDFKNFNAKNFDWYWSDYLRRKGVKLLCFENSLVQHIGFHGQNSKLYFDVGQGFKVETIEQGQILNNILVSAFQKIRDIEKSRQLIDEISHAKKANDLHYNLKRVFVIIFKKIFRRY